MIRPALIAAALVVSATAAAEPAHRDPVDQHRVREVHEPRMIERGHGPVVVDARPRTAPPPLRIERFERRRGFTWIRGRWDWRDGNWAWLPGRYETERAHLRWREPRWELRDGAYALVDGAWIDDTTPPEYPIASPPPVRDERYEPRAGFVWIRGRWDWRAGRYTWLAGHYEREHPSAHWTDGHWEQRGDRYAWVDGAWSDAGAAHAP